jgi:hypothetical protein
MKLFWLNLLKVTTPSLRSQASYVHLALPQDSHSLRGSTRDLWTAAHTRVKSVHRPRIKVNDEAGLILRIMTFPELDLGVLNQNFPPHVPGCVL